VASTATILLNATMMAAVGTMIVTPDAPLLVASASSCIALAKVLETDAARGGWWSAPRWGRAVVEIYALFSVGDPDLADPIPKLRRWLISHGRSSALWSRWRCSGRHSMECRSPVGVISQQFGRARIENFNPASW